MTAGRAARKKTRAGHAAGMRTAGRGGGRKCANGEI